MKYINKIPKFAAATILGLLLLLIIAFVFLYDSSIVLHHDYLTGDAQSSKSQSKEIRSKVIHYSGRIEQIKPDQITSPKTILMEETNKQKGRVDDSFYPLVYCDC